MEAKTNLGVVIVNYNAHQQLEQCLSCLFQQRVMAERILVVENGDRSAEFEGSWSSRGVEFLSAGGNVGFAAGNNLAIAQLDDCTLVALVNPDAYLAPNWIEEMLSAAERHPRCGSFSARLVMASDERLLDGVGDAYHISGLLWRRGHGVLSARCSLSECEVFSACAAAAVYRRTALAEVGGFDERFFCYAEDVDLGFRLRLAGYPCLLVPSAVARHEGSVTTGGRGSDFSTYHGHRNLEWVYVKNMPWGLLLLTFPLHILLVLVTLVTLAMRGQGVLGVKSKWHAVRAIGSVLSARREIQKRRRVSIGELLRTMDKTLIWRRTFVASGQAKESRRV